MYVCQSDWFMYVYYPCAFVLQLGFRAKKENTDEIDTQLGIEIQILDINDHPPRFERDLYETNIAGTVTQGKFHSKLHPLFHFFHINSI